VKKDKLVSRNLREAIMYYFRLVINQNVRLIMDITGNIMTSNEML